MSVIEDVIDISAKDASNVFGQFDSHLKKIEKTLFVSIINRADTIKIVGGSINVERAKAVIKDLAALSERGNTITEQNVDYALAMCYDEKSVKLSELDDTIICRTISGKPVKPKTANQKIYTDNIKKSMVTFGIGPAGTGKTYLAMAMAINSFKTGEVSRIILTRPAIEAGENLGFLPGDLQSKVDPYLRPLYDALYQIMGAESFMSNSEKGLIEVAPLAYMRGRTLDNAFIILDEAQNTTPAQMKMFLTRIGFGSKAVITGDLTQKDLPKGQISGLDVAVKVLDNIEDIKFSYLKSVDVVRHPVVQRIVDAYEKYEARQNAKDAYKKNKLDKKQA